MEHRPGRPYVGQTGGGGTYITTLAETCCQTAQLRGTPRLTVTTTRRPRGTQGAAHQSSQQPCKAPPPCLDPQVFRDDLTDEIQVL